MYQSIQLRNTSPTLGNPPSRSTLRLSFILTPLIPGSFALSPAARAVEPPPDGGYPNYNTAEGDAALFNLTTGVRNTAVGFDSLLNTTDGSDNAATGASALFHNTTGAGNTADGVETL